MAEIQPARFELVIPTSDEEVAYASQTVQAVFRAFNEAVDRALNTDNGWISKAVPVSDELDRANLKRSNGQPTRRELTFGTTKQVVADTPSTPFYMQHYGAQARLTSTCTAPEEDPQGPSIPTMYVGYEVVTPRPILLRRELGLDRGLPEHLLNSVQHGTTEVFELTLTEETEDTPEGVLAKKAFGAATTALNRMSTGK